MTASRPNTTLDALFEVDREQHRLGLMWDRNPEVDQQQTRLETLSELKPIPADDLGFDAFGDDR